jgi:hypothetical protein
LYLLWLGWPCCCLVFVLTFAFVVLLVHLELLINF